MYSECIFQRSIQEEMIETYGKQDIHGVDLRREATFKLEKENSSYLRLPPSSITSLQLLHTKGKLMKSH